MRRMTLKALGQMVSGILILTISVQMMFLQGPLEAWYLTNGWTESAFKAGASAFLTLLILWGAAALPALMLLASGLNKLEI